MYGQRPPNNWNQSLQTVGFGNYGYGIYTQDIEYHRNRLTGRAHIDRDVDFVPLGYGGFGPYSPYLPAVHRHYHT